MVRVPTKARLSMIDSLTTPPLPSSPGNEDDLLAVPAPVHECPLLTEQDTSVLGRLPSRERLAYAPWLGEGPGARSTTRFSIERSAKPRLMCLTLALLRPQPRRERRWNVPAGGAICLALAVVSNV
jgi:hypothetical protein